MHTASQFSIAVRVKPLPRDAPPNSDLVAIGAKALPFLSLAADTSQRAAYEQTVAPLVRRIVGGGASSAVLMCYGQTGSGKTHTVFGPPASLTEASLAAARTAALPAPVADANAQLHASASESVSVHGSVPMSAAAAPDSWGCFGRALVDLLNAPGVERSALSVSAVEIYLDRVSCV